jgi:hypothetical protein
LGLVDGDRPANGDRKLDAVDNVRNATLHPIVNKFDSGNIKDGLALVRPSNNYTL